jgi:hypothetical protein
MCGNYTPSVRPSVRPYRLFCFTNSQSRALHNITIVYIYTLAKQSYITRVGVAFLSRTPQVFGWNFCRHTGLDSFVAFLSPSRHVEGLYLAYVTTKYLSQSTVLHRRKTNCYAYTIFSWKSVILSVFSVRMTDKLGRDSEYSDVSKEHTASILRVEE